MNQKGNIRIFISPIKIDQLLFFLGYIHNSGYNLQVAARKLLTDYLVTSFELH